MMSNNNIIDKTLVLTIIHILLEVRNACRRHFRLVHVVQKAQWEDIHNGDVSKNARIVQAA